MRILQVHTRYRQPGGEDSVVEEERALLLEGGHDVESVQLENPIDSKQAVLRLATAAWNRVAARSVAEMAQRVKPDVVHVHNTWFALSNAVFPGVAKAGFPTVATFHNYRLSCVNALFYRDDRICQDCLGKVPWRGVMHRCYRDSAVQSGAVAVSIMTHRLRDTWRRDVGVVIAPTSFARDALVASGVPADSVVVKPNSVRDPGPRPATPSESNEVLFVGSLFEGKGVLDLVRAWRQVPKPGMKLVLIGDGPSRPQVLAEADDAVELIGRLPRAEVQQRMLAARAIVVPSRWFEVMPVALLEGLAAGVPVVVPSHGAFLETAGGAAIPFSAGDLPSLSAAIRGLHDADTVNALGRHARARYEGLFTPADDRRALERVYQRAIGN